MAILPALRTENPLVRRYSRKDNLRRANPHSERLAGLPREPYVGEIGYGKIREVLRSRGSFLTRAERGGVESLDQYLSFKKRQAPVRGG